MASVEQIANVIQFLAAGYPAAKLAPETVAVYAAMLGDLQEADLKRAALWCLTHLKFFPSVAELRLAVADSDATHRLPDVDEAWAEVQTAIRKWGQRYAPEWSCPVVEAAVAGIGWRAICMSEEPDIIRAHFYKLYPIVRARHQDRQQALPEGGAEKVFAQIATLASKMRALPGGSR